MKLFKFIILILILNTSVFAFENPENKLFLIWSKDIGHEKDFGRFIPIDIRNSFEEKFSSLAGECRIVNQKVENINLRIIDYFSRNTNSNFENLRSEPKYEKSNNNVIAKIPNGSMVKLLSDPIKDYLKVEVISIAETDDKPKDNFPVSKIGDSGFIYLDSLKLLNLYDLQLNQNAYTTNKGTEYFINLENKSLKLISSDFNVQALECCHTNKCEIYNPYKVNSIDGFSETQKEMIVFLNDKTPEIFSTVTAQISETYEDDISDTTNVEDEDTNSSLKEQNLSEEELEKKQLADSGDGDTEDTLKKPISSISGIHPYMEFYKKVVCTKEGGDIVVRDEKEAKHILFEMQNGSHVRVFQGSDYNEIKINDNQYILVKFDNDKTGRIAKQFLKNESDCESLKVKRLEKAYICTNDADPLRARDNLLDRIIEKIDHGTTVERIKNNSPPVKYLSLSNEKYKYIPIQLNKRELWVPERFVSTKSCSSSTDTSSAGSTQGSLIFPLRIRPSASYKTGQRRFGAGRKGSRIHAATDFWTQRYNGSKYDGGPFRSIAQGKVVRGSTEFYLKTYYIAIYHPEIKSVIRYGEIYPNRIRAGESKTKGQELGVIKWVGIRSVPPMLHFEAFIKTTSTMRGELKGKNKYQRNSALYNPTKLVTDLERKTFGKSW